MEIQTLREAGVEHPEKLTRKQRKELLEKLPEKGKLPD